MQLQLRELRTGLWDGIRSIGAVELNGYAQQCIPGILNVSFYGIDGESLQLALRDLAVSAGSACSTGAEQGSHVLRAIGLSNHLAQSSLRFSFGHFTTEADVDFAIMSVKRELSRLRELYGS